MKSLSQAARRLTTAVERETALARTGVLAELARAGEAKRALFIEFSCACREAAVQQPSPLDREALHRLLTAADENMLVLDAVRATLEDAAVKLRAALSSAADPGTYGLTERRRHVLAAQLDASV
jgi:hypothetical protein